MSAPLIAYREKLRTALHQALFAPPAGSGSDTIARLTRQGLLIRAEAFADALKWLDEEEGNAANQPLCR